MKSKRVVILVMTIVFIGLMMVYSASNIWAGYKFNDSLYYICLLYTSDAADEL